MSDYRLNTKSLRLAGETTTMRKQLRPKLNSSLQFVHLADLVLTNRLEDQTVVCSSAAIVSAALRIAVA
jgi:hypothetical protein